MSRSWMTLRPVGVFATTMIFAVACGGHDEPKLISNPPAQAASIALDSSIVHLTVGGQHQFVASVTSTAGGPLENAAVSWNSVNASIITVTQTGLVHAVAPGSTTVTAVAGPHIAIASVVVNPAPPASRMALAGAPGATRR
ncbi:MAG TPA: Ig-like domain-containing protein [Gemmatimonadaceae bacterium]|nr:Ig-like domain-containing protein [Gemmatimonadaceae bacterium]